MRLELKELELENFKGVKYFNYSFNGENIAIYGANETGKTTLQDAFCWLFTGKNSQGVTDFNVKTLDRNNNVIPGLEHKVKAVITINGKELTLAKIYLEKHSTKRGQATSEFKGHTTNHFINGVPVTKGEYDRRISEIGDEETIRLFSNANYFNTQLPWTKRREILIERFGNVTDQEVIEVHQKQLGRLPEILGNYSLEEYQKIVAAQKKELKREIEKLPVRIDEVFKGLPDIKGITKETIEVTLKELRNRKRALERELADLEGGGKIAENRRKRNELEALMIELKSQHELQYRDEITAKKIEVQELQHKIKVIENQISGYKMDIKLCQTGIEKAESQKIYLREKWERVNGEQFEFTVEGTCYACGQELPEDQVQKTLDKALEKFNQEKAEQLEAINAHGVALKQQTEEGQIEIEELQTNISKTENQLEKLNNQIAQLEGELTKLQDNIPALNDNPEYFQAWQEKEELEEQLIHLKEEGQEVRKGIETAINNTEVRIGQLEGDFSKLNQHQTGLDRIEELKSQEKQLAKEFEELENQIYLMESFIRAKVAMIEELINDHFEYVNFKLFEEQINGGIKEVCETLYKGVPYSTDLNTGGRINADIDILNTLSKSYNYFAPIWIDNAESVTWLIPSASQLICNIVSKPDKKLRIEPLARVEMAEVI